MSNEKFAYSIVSKNLQEYFKGKMKHDPVEFEFLMTNVSMKKGPVSNMLEVFKSEFKKDSDNYLLGSESRKKLVKKRGKLWSSELGSAAQMTKKALERKQRFK